MPPTIRKGRLLVAIVCLSTVALSAMGCSQSALRLQSPQSLQDAVDNVTYVGDVAVPYGLHPLQVDAIGMVAGLRGTGSDPPPSSERSVLVSDIQRRDIARPNSIIASDQTSLVLVRGYMRPGIQQGDVFDVEVFVPRDSETTSLSNGVLLESRMRERAVLEGRWHEGSDLALVRGPVLVDLFASDGEDPKEMRRGIILGGGVARKSRPLGLLLKPDQKDIGTSAALGTAINKRFHVTNEGIKSGVARPKTDGYVELILHPRYKDNLSRYLRVVRGIAMRETDVERQIRLQLLQRQLLDPLTAASAAVRLEAIGREAIDILRKGINSSDTEVRFYAAEALAYLDVEDAAEPLANAARDEPAFRPYALAALSAMDQPAAHHKLVEMLSSKSAETRYGAFRALWAMDQTNPIVRGEYLKNRFHLHVVECTGPSMIHIARSFRPEIVLFGSRQNLRTPLILDAGEHIRVNGTKDGRVSVKNFAPGMEDSQIEVSARVDEVVAAIVGVGGTYPDVVQALVQAKASHSLDCRLEVDAIPGRPQGYQPNKQPEVSGDSRRSTPVASPEPDLYRGPPENKRSNPTARKGDPEPSEKEGETADIEPDSSWSLTRYVGKIINRRRD
ncbi:MAG TPA: flagellar basal body P-ring protein FlgI [Pirellulales bacterium]|nr:flagellar basal body P-ring protein FlgI [Pirellulales bacterium]